MFEIKVQNGCWQGLVQVQNTESQERYRKWLRDKGKSANPYKVQCDVQTRTGTKNWVEKIG